MELVKRLPIGRQLILGAGVLLLIDTFLPWQKVSIGPFSNSWSAWHGFWGVVLGLLTIALLAWVAARALGVELPATVPDSLATAALGVLILLFAVIKNLVDDYSAWGSYLGVVLAIGVAAGAWMVFASSGESLPSTGRPSSTPPTSDAPPEGPAGTDSI